MPEMPRFAPIPAPTPEVQPEPVLEVTPAEVTSELPAELLTELDASVAEAHEAKEYRPVGIAVVRNQAGEVLLVKPVKDSEVWIYPQGGIDEGETILAGLRRELGEELGIAPEDVVVEAFLEQSDQDAEEGRKDKRGFTKGKRFFCFRVAYSGDGELTPDPNEISTYQWATPEDARGLVRATRPSKTELLQRIAEV